MFRTLLTCPQLLNEHSGCSHAQTDHINFHYRHCRLRYAGEYAVVKGNHLHILRDTNPTLGDARLLCRDRDGGATIADSDAYKAFLNVGQVFNQLARIFSGASSIINNINVIYKSIVELNNLLGGFIKK